MRAYDLALILALFGAVMGVLDSSAVWPDASLYTGSDVINQTTFDEINKIEDPNAFDVLKETMMLGWAAMLLLLSVLMRIVWIADIIASAFGNSPEAVQVSLAIQAGIWLTYAIALFQMKTGKSVKGME